jgi:hypothetical protein
MMILFHFEVMVLMLRLYIKEVVNMTRAMRLTSGDHNYVLMVHLESRELRSGSRNHGSACTSRHVLLNRRRSHPVHFFQGQEDAL